MRKRRFASRSALVATAILALAAGRAIADGIVEERFDYDLQALIDGQDGGIGFDGPWIASKSHGRDYRLEFAGLTFTDDDGEELDVSGNSLSRFGSAGRAEAHRLLSEDARDALTQDGTTIWFGMLVAAPSAHRWGSFCFGTHEFSTAGTPLLGDGDDDRNPPFTPFDGEGLGFTLMTPESGAGDGTIHALAFDGSFVPVVSPGTFTQPILDGATHHETSLIVGKINWGSDGDADELFLFDVTDRTEEPDEEDAIASITDLDLDQGDFDRIAVWDTNNTIFDEIRFGTSFFDVVGASPPRDPVFRRGETDDDASVALTDAVRILAFLFQGAEPPGCLEAADADDNGRVDLTDAVRILGFLFQGAAPPPAPGPVDCGPDPTPDGTLGCEVYESC